MKTKGRKQKTNAKAQMQKKTSGNMSEFKKSEKYIKNNEIK